MYAYMYIYMRARAHVYVYNIWDAYTRITHSLRVSLLKSEKKAWTKERYRVVVRERNFC